MKLKKFGPFFSKVYSLLSSITPSSRRYYRVIAEDIECHGNSRILDVGCGGGHLISTILGINSGVKAFGTDPSPSMIDLARKKTLQYTGSAEFRTGDCMNVPFDGKFDVIFSSSSYHHWGDQHACLENLAAMLNESGSLRIYEYYSEENGKSSKETHSLSNSEASAMTITGCSRTIRMLGNVIAVTFQKEGQ